MSRERHVLLLPSSVKHQEPSSRLMENSEGIYFANALLRGLPCHWSWGCLPNVFCTREREVTYCFCAYAIRQSPSPAWYAYFQHCTAHAMQLSHTRYWYDLEGVFHTLTLVYVDRSREVVSVSQSRSKPRTHKKNNPRPTLPTPSPPQNGPTFFRHIAMSLYR